jgi:hypothetical protein
MCAPVPWGLDSLPESQEKLNKLLAMEDALEPGVQPLGVPSPNFPPGELQREKLVELEGQPGGVGETQREGLSQGRGGRKPRSEEGSPPRVSCSRLGAHPPGQPRTRYTTRPMPVGNRQVGPSDQHEP